MKIKRIHLRVVNVPERQHVLPWWSDGYYGQPLHQWAEHGIVEVETDTGLIGLTQIERFTPDAVVEEQLNGWLGCDILAVNLMEPVAVMSGSFEGAILDLRAQALGVPVHQLLGGRLRAWVPVTQCTGYKSPENTAKDAQWGWEQGFRHYKMKCITAAEISVEARLRYVVDRVEAIHRVLPDMVVRPDIRWRLEDVWVAQELVRRLQGHALECLESPITKQAAAGTFSEWRRLRQTIALPVADHVSDAADLIRRFQAEALDYAIVGAATATATLAQSRLAHSLGMGGWSQTVAYGPGAALGLHVAACMPNLSQPYDMVGPMAWQDDLINEPFDFANGAFSVPDRPGLGFTLNRDAAQKYLVREKVFQL